MDGYEKFDEGQQLSSGKRLATVVAAVSITFCTSGLVFGFSAIYGVLLSHGVFRELCADDVETCDAQAVGLTRMFTIATSALNIAALPTGALLDRAGPRLSGIIGCVGVACGCFIFGSGSQDSNGELYYNCGFLLMAVCGPSVFLSVVTFGNYFPDCKGTITAACVGAFDASSAVFIGLRALYTHGVPFELLFKGYALVPVGGTILMLVLWPLQPVPSPAAGLFHDTGPSKLHTLAVEGHTLKSLLLSGEFVLTAFAVSASMLLLNFFIATSQQQMESCCSEEAESLNGVFAAMLPAGGIIWVPVIGYIVDTLGKAKAWAILGISLICHEAFSILHAYFHLDALAYTSFTVFSFARPLLYTVAASFVAEMFGDQHLGTCYGLIFAIAGLVNTLVSSLKQFASSYGFVAVNSRLLLLECFTLSLPALLVWHFNQLQDKKPQLKRKLSRMTTAALDGRSRSLSVSQPPRKSVSSLDTDRS